MINIIAPPPPKKTLYNPIIKENPLDHVYRGGGGGGGYFLMVLY